MGDSILNVGFFDDETIPSMLKLSLSALCLNGTYDAYKRGNGRIQSYAITVKGGKNAETCMIVGEHGNSESAAKGLVSAYAEIMSSPSCDMHGIANGKFKDLVVIEKLYNEDLVRHGTNEDAKKARAASNMEKMKKLLKGSFESGSINAEQFSAGEKFIESYNAMCLEGKKKQSVTEQNKN